ncbi:hypothetical protein ACIGO6_39110 [Streptomyces sp. NPDC053750]|uniref:hypothetical protein n=1 Tax=Streptomyces sp. NPDC053750 TaxID=3365714 RepID=UPI0037D1B19C
MELERQAEAARARCVESPDGETRAAWRDVADVFQTAVTEYAAAEGESRIDVGMAAKKTVWHPQAEAA